MNILKYVRQFLKPKTPQKINRYDDMKKYYNDGHGRQRTNFDEIVIDLPDGARVVYVVKLNHMMVIQLRINMFNKIYYWPYKDKYYDHEDKLTGTPFIDYVKATDDDRGWYPYEKADSAFRRTAESANSPEVESIGL